MDVISAALAGGRRSRVLAFADDFTSECPGMMVGMSLCGQRVGRELARIVERR